MHKHESKGLEGFLARLESSAFLEFHQNIKIEENTMKMTFVRLYIIPCLFALLLVPFVALPGTVSAQTSSPDVARIDALITSHMQADHIPGVAVVIVNGSQVIHQRGFGIADSTGRAVTPQTPFLLGSITKSFTALAIMQLVEADKIDLDAPVQLYLPWFHVADRNASTQITVRNLMNHTSGMPTGAGETAALRTETMEQFVRSLGTVELTSPVGKTFQYCNANYITLGLLIQTVSGQEYGTYIQRNILTPLGMQHSYVSVPQAQRHGLAQGYHWLFGMPTPVDDPDSALSCSLTSRIAHLERGGPVSLPGGPDEWRTLQRHVGTFID